MFVGIPVSTSKTQFFINQAYVSFISGAGHMPLLIYPESNLEYYTEVCGALLLPGGIDIDPTYYGDDNHYSSAADPAKDMFERHLFYSFINAKKPIFGICRGFQLILREYLFQNETPKIEYLQNINNHNSPQSLSTERHTPTHSIIASFKKLWNSSENENYYKTFVNSMHHQGAVILDKVLLKEEKIEEGNRKSLHVKHNDITILAYTHFGKIQNKNNYKYIIEAIDINFDGVLVRGVQWHPEELKDYNLLNTYLSTFEQKQVNINAEIEL